ncbi:MAG: hypothetical protein Phyf2KO_16890 [Phycisphaerales bacterium]
MRRAMVRLEHRMSQIERIVHSQWLVGAFIGWDIAPRQTADGNRVLSIHIHILGEPYQESQRGEDWVLPPKEIEQCWARSAQGAEDGQFLGVDRISQGAQDAVTRLLYTAGVCEIGDESAASFYPKFLRGFDPEHTPGRDSRGRLLPLPPRLAELYMIHAAFACQHGQWPRWIGGWDWRSRIGRLIRDVSGRRSFEMRQNDPTLRDA